MNKELENEAYEALMELAKHPDFLISLAKIGEKARKSGEKLKEAMQPETKFYRNQPVLVRDIDSGTWKKGIFDGFRKDSGFIYKAYAFVENFGTGTSNSYKHCKPDPDAESIINWVEHDGSIGEINRPKNTVLITVSCSDVVHKYSGNCSATLQNIVRYAIIPLPEFLS